MKNLWMPFTCAIFLAFAFLPGCGGGSSSSSSSTTPTQTISSPGANVATISVNGGPMGNYVDAPFTSVTVCVPGTSNCQTIDNVLVDTGSTGLRILSSAMTIALPQQTSGNDSVVECFPFVSGNTWGPVQTADVEIAGEKASSVPIQVIGETTFNPSGICTAPQDDLDSLGSNGILGVGLFAQDCGSSSCPASVDVYYDCPASGTCTAATEASAQEVQNPVSLFATDNNGVILELPAVSGSEASVSGSLVFGIGTESNNALGGATIYTADQYGNFTTTYNGTAYPDSFIDSGSNGYFFLDSALSGIAGCTGEEPGFYCPVTTANISATNQGNNGKSGAISFSVADANTLFQSGDSAFSELGGISGTSAPYYFDWGLPFFFGRNVYTGLQSATYPNGYWAY
jgi:predicted aspartyl protease